MREIDGPDEVVAFCREHGWIGPGPARAEALPGGVSNAVFRVQQADTLFVLKQARARLRTREDWFSDVDRIWREVDAMQTLEPLLAPGTVPRILHRRDADHAYAMSHAPLDSQVWKSQLLAGEVDPALGRLAGRVLGTIHQRTAADPALAARFGDRTAFVQLRVEPFYQRLQARRPDLARPLGRLVDEMLGRADALTHGDFSPKNILTHRDGFTLVDYETAHLGDPAMDPGFFLSHLLLKACKHAPRRDAFFDLTRAFWRGYAEAGYRTPGEMVARSTGHLGACLLVRIDGTSPVDYLPGEPEREAVRALARTLLLEPPGDWEGVLAAADNLFAPLRPAPAPHPGEAR